MSIKHRKVHKFVKRAPTHLEGIAEYITKGVADAAEKIILHPQRCDIKNGKRHDPQHCVLARTGLREYDAEAMAVGRAYSYFVQDGVAIRFRNPPLATHYVDAFDEYGAATTMPIVLLPPLPSKRLRKQQPGSRPSSSRTRRAPMKKIGVRAIGGGKTKK